MRLAADLSLGEDVRKLLLTTKFCKMFDYSDIRRSVVPPDDGCTFATRLFRLNEQVRIRYSAPVRDKFATTLDGAGWTYNLRKHDRSELLTMGMYATFSWLTGHFLIQAGSVLRSL